MGEEEDGERQLVNGNSLFISRITSTKLNHVVLWPCRDVVDALKLIIDTMCRGERHTEADGRGWAGELELPDTTLALPHNVLYQATEVFPGPSCLSRTAPFPNGAFVFVLRSQNVWSNHNTRFFHSTMKSHRASSSFLRRSGTALSTGV